MNVREAVTYYHYMISNLGKYIPIIFLIISIFVFVDCITSFSLLRDIQNQQHTIAQAYQHIYSHIPQTIIQRKLFQQYKLTLDMTVSHMYIVIILSAVLNLLLVAFAYIAINRELRHRTHLERNKDEFISLTSHELRTPITTINIFSEMLANKTILKGDREAKHILSKMRIQISEMKKLIDDLLDVTRIQLGKFELQKERFNLSEIIQGTIEDIQTISKRHTITLRAPKLVNVIADKQRIWQVVANLLNNAVKYSPQGGKIQVRIHRKRSAVVVSIKDQGIGISKENQSRIFHRYFREVGNTEREYSGLGLGLYLSKQIIQLHNGTIWVKSVPKKGSTFYFSLPLVQNWRHSLPSDPPKK